MALRTLTSLLRLVRTFPVVTDASIFSHYINPELAKIANDPQVGSTPAPSCPPLIRPGLCLSPLVPRHPHHALPSSNLLMPVRSAASLWRTSHLAACCLACLYV